MKKQISNGYDAGRWIFDAYAQRKISFQAIAFGFYLLDVWNRRRKGTVLLTPTDASIDLGISRDSSSKYWAELERAGLFETLEIVGQTRAKRIEFVFRNAEDNAENFRIATYIEKKIRKEENKKEKNKEKFLLPEFSENQIEEFAEAIIQPENESWIFTLAQAIGGKDSILPALEKFVIFAKGNQRTYSDKKEFQKHFFNWATLPNNQKKFKYESNHKSGFSANLNDWARRANSQSEISNEDFGI